MSAAIAHVMWWHLWTVIALVCAAIIPAAERGVLMLIAFGIAGLSLALPMLHPDVSFLIAALVWISAGTFLIATKGRKFALPALFLILSGVFKLPARLSGAGYEFGNVWLAVSDVAGLAAILLVGRTGVGSFVDRVKRMVGRVGNSGHGSLARLYGLQAQQVTKGAWRDR